MNKTVQLASLGCTALFAICSVVLSACTRVDDVLRDADVRQTPESDSMVYQANSHDDSIGRAKLLKYRAHAGDTIAGKHVSFFLGHPLVAAIAKSFYHGTYVATDSDSTRMLLDNVLDTNSTIRPFYVWCLDAVIHISDGALGEYPGEPAFQYASLYPREFFEFMDDDPTGSRYERWVDMMAYSGPPAFVKDPTDTLAALVRDMYEHIEPVDAHTRMRIRQLSTDILKSMSADGE